MRVFISSTPDELEPHQTAACDVAHGLNIEPVLRDPAAGHGLERVAACARQVASADLVLAIVGWRRGRTPPPELGGDGLHAWTHWEVKSAFDHRKPVLVLMAAESWRPELREEDSRARALMQDFRGELDRLAVFFEDEPVAGDGSRPLEAFRELVRRQLVEAQRNAPTVTAPTVTTPPDVAPSLDSASGLRRWPPPRLPERPYPLLLPYTHPDLMAGRERELDELRQLLTRPVPLLGLYAPSGTGKSSLLAGGLIPKLRAEGRPVAFDRHPCEAGIANRLIGDLLVDQELEIQDDDPRGFVDQLLIARGLAGEPPVLVLDQFEDLFHAAAPRRAAPGRCSGP